MRKLAVVYGERSRTILVVLFLLGFAAPSSAQIQRDTVNGWYPQLITSGITKFYSRLVQNTDPDPQFSFLGKRSQLWRMNMPFGEKVRVIKRLGKEYDVPWRIEFSVRYSAVNLTDSSSFGFNFFFSNRDTVKWLSGNLFEGKLKPYWSESKKAQPLLSNGDYEFKSDDMIADTVDIKKFDAIGVRFRSFNKDLDLTEITFDNIKLVYADGSKIILDDFESDVVAKGAFEFPAGTYNFGSVKIGWQKTAKLRGTNIGKSDLSVSKVETTDSSFSVSPATATIQPDSSVVFSVTFAPNAGTVSGKVQYLIFH
ncbi:MAG: DUF1573 domain-containing protein, partial [Patescibacteria group bacterium]